MLGSRFASYRSLSRRQLLAASGGATMASVLASCDFLATSPSGETDGRSGGSAGARDHQAPMLSDLVEKGDLPPLADRLPAAPLVIEPTERIGVYGGTWNAIIQSASDTGWINATAGYDQLLRWDAEFTEVLPNIAESFEVASEGREYVFRLREGMLWSDGKPFTAEDIAFAYDDILTNADIYPVVPTYLAPTGEPATVEAVDELTVVVRFDTPNGLFPMRVASASGELLTVWPKHYLSEFHRDFNPEAPDLASEEGFSHWSELFLAKAERWNNPELPTLTAWKSTKVAGADNRVVVERNPYYWKVDPDGNQLPYVDNVSYEVINNEDVILLKVAQGEIHFDMWRVGTPANKPVLAPSRESGGFRFFDCIWAFMNNMMIAFNLCSKDAAKREIFRNRDFRIGASHAINRTELVDVVLQGQGEPWQGAPRPESKFFHEELAKQFTEFDVDLADEHLNRAGLDARDADGFRLRPDGERLSFVLDVPATGGDPTFVAASELLERYWKDVGLHVSIRSMDISLFTARQEANDFDATVFQGEWGLNDAMLSPHWYMPSGGTASLFALPWAQWYESRGAAGEEPPDAARRQLDLYDQLQQSTDSAEQEKLFGQILDIAKDEFYAIGTSLAPATFGIAKTNFHNVPDPVYRVYPNPGFTNPQQYFIAD